MLVSALTFVGFGCLAVMIIAVLCKIVREGPSEIRKLRRQGYGVEAAFRGNVIKSDAGTTIDVKEGLEFIADQGRLRSIRQTRTISNDIA